MSRLIDKEDLLKANFEAIFPGNKYNIYTEPEEEGYTSPYIVIDGCYDNEDDSSDCTSFLETHPFNVVIGMNYQKGYKKQTKALLAEDLEKIFDNLSGIKPGSICIDYAFNQCSEHTVDSIFTIIK